MSRRVGVAAALLALPAAVALSTSALWRRQPSQKEWTGPFNQAEYRAFLNAIGLYFGVRKIPITVKGGELTIEAPEGPRRELLGALAEVCHRHDRSQWPDLVARHFAEPEAEPAGEWPAFSAAVQAYFRERGLEATVEDEAAVVRDSAGVEERFEAPGLRAGSERVPPEEWPAFIERTFGSMLRARVGVEGVESRSFAEARDLLAVTLVGERELAAKERASSVHGQDLPGLLSLVVWRLPGGTERLARAQAERWGPPCKEVLAVARANLARLRPPVERVTLVQGVEALRLQAEGEFVAAQALLVGEEPEWTGAYGALLALPHCGALLVCPLKPTPGGAVAVAGAVMSLIVRIQQMAEGAAAPLSPNLYWYHDGRYTGLPYRVEMAEGRPRIDFEPPQSFAKALVALRDEGAA